MVGIHPSDEKLIEDMLENVRKQSPDSKLVVILPVAPAGDDLDEEITTDIKLHGYEIEAAYGIPVHKSLGRVLIIARADSKLSSRSASSSVGSSNSLV